jgi:hypothetical protein
MTEKIALVTGVNKGLKREISRRWNPCFHFFKQYCWSQRFFAAGVRGLQCPQNAFGCLAEAG